MGYEQIVATWVSFMLTAFKKAHGFSRKQVNSLSSRYDLIPFLFDNYELLHYYDNSYITADIERYIAEQGGSLHG